MGERRKEGEMMFCPFVTFAWSKRKQRSAVTSVLGVGSGLLGCGKGFLDCRRKGVLAGVLGSIPRFTSTFGQDVSQSHGQEAEGDAVKGPDLVLSPFSPMQRSSRPRSFT
jgi:hypothetical protein